MNTQDQETQPKQTQPDTRAGASQAYRQTSRAVLQDMLTRLERKQGHIRTLLAMLPTEMSREQDEALWQIACEMTLS